MAWPYTLRAHLSGGGSIHFQEMKLGRPLAPGHDSSVGAPSALKISSSWFMSLLPANHTYAGQASQDGQGRMSRRSGKLQVRRERQGGCQALPLS
jgi:hypothetical protein